MSDLHEEPREAFEPRRGPADWWLFSSFSTLCLHFGSIFRIFVRSPALLTKCRMQKNWGELWWFKEDLGRVLVRFFDVVSMRPWKNNLVKINILS